MTARRPVAEIAQVRGLEKQALRGNGALKNTFTKIAPWNWMAGNTLGMTPATSRGRACAAQVNYLMLGDSTAGLVMCNLSGGTPRPYRGVVGSLLDAAGACGGFYGYYTVTGNVWAADGTGGKPWDYTVFPSGGYWRVDSGGTIKPGSNGYATEWAFYYVKESGAGTATIELLDNAAAVRTVGGVSATLSINCANASLSAGKAGFVFQHINNTTATAGQYRLAFGGQTTGDLAYNASPATVQAALEALSTIGAGNVGVETYWRGGLTVLIRRAVPGWSSLDWSDGTTPLTGYLTMPVFTDSTSAVRLTTNSGSVRILGGAWVADRSVPGVVVMAASRGGLMQDNASAWDSAVMSVVLGDFRPDLVSWAFVLGQDGTETTQRALMGKLAAAHSRSDLVVLGAPPKWDASDAAIAAANVALRRVANDYGALFFDTHDLVGGWAGISALGSTWTGDGVHLGNAHNAYCGSVIARQLGIATWAGVPAGGGAVAMSRGTAYELGIEFSKSVSALPAARIAAEPSGGLDLNIQMLTNNRCVTFRDCYGTPIGQIGTYPDGGLGNFFYHPVYFGTSAASTVPSVRSGSGSPEGSKTAAVGSLYLRTDGGAGSTLYVKESGTGNTGWVAK